MLEQRGLGCVAALALLAGCGADPAPPADTGEAWETLVEGDWQIPAGVEGYRCVRTTLSEDVDIGAFEAVAPVGTHHTLLGIDADDGQPDGTAACTAADVGTRILYGSGVGTPAFELPHGTSLRLRAGTRLVLNLHLFNTRASELSGTSGVRFRRTDDATIEHALEGLLAGPQSFVIPPSSTHVESGTCTFREAGGIVAMMPHMHALGIHMRASLLRTGGTEEPLVDEDYLFDDQHYRLLEPSAEVAAGDALRVTCTWHNPGAEAVAFGTSSNSEMCFALVLRWPETGEGPTCTDEVR